PPRIRASCFSRISRPRSTAPGWGFSSPASWSPTTVARWNSRAWGPAAPSFASGCRLQCAVRSADCGIWILWKGALLPMNKAPPVADGAALRNSADTGTSALRTPHSASRTSFVLVIDDEPVIRDTLAEYLGQEGFCVATCASGEQALELAQQQCFDV